MPDFPRALGWPPPESVISTAGQESAYADAVENSGNALNQTSGYSANNQAKYVPVLLTVPVVVTKLAWLNGATLGSNIDVGIYDDNGLRLVSSGAVAQSGVSAVQVADITDTPLGPGCYYLAL